MCQEKNLKISFIDRIRLGNLWKSGPYSLSLFFRKLNFNPILWCGK